MVRELIGAHTHFKVVRSARLERAAYGFEGKDSELSNLLYFQYISIIIKFLIFIFS